MRTTTLMRMDLHIEVTDDHIRRGKLCDSGSCPVALAVIDAIEASPEWQLEVGGGEYTVHVDSLLQIKTRDIIWRTEVPPYIGTFIALFDAGVCVSTFAADLTLESHERTN